MLGRAFELAGVELIVDHAPGHTPGSVTLRSGHEAMFSGDLLFAGSIGVAGGADIPVSLVLLVIPVTLLLANLLAAGPGWAAAR